MLHASGTSTLCAARQLAPPFVFLAAASARARRAQLGLVEGRRRDDPRRRAAELGRQPDVGLGRGVELGADRAEARLGACDVHVADARVAHERARALDAAVGRHRDDAALDERREQLGVRRVEPRPQGVVLEEHGLAAAEHAVEQVDEREEALVARAEHEAARPRARALGVGGVVVVVAPELGLDAGRARPERERAERARRAPPVGRALVRSGGGAPRPSAAAR